MKQEMLRLQEKNEIYPFLKKEGYHSNQVALTGFSEQEVDCLLDFLQCV